MWKKCIKLSGCRHHPISRTAWTVLTPAKKRPILRAADAERLGRQTSYSRSWMKVPPTRRPRAAAARRRRRERASWPGYHCRSGFPAASCAALRARVPRNRPRILRGLLARRSSRTRAKVSWPPPGIVHFSGRAMTEGIETIGDGDGCVSKVCRRPSPTASSPEQLGMEVFSKRSRMPGTSKYPRPNSHDAQVQGRARRGAPIPRKQ